MEASLRPRHMQGQQLAPTVAPTVCGLKRESALRLLASCAAGEGAQQESAVAPSEPVITMKASARQAQVSLFLQHIYDLVCSL